MKGETRPTVTKTPTDPSDDYSWNCGFEGDDGVKADVLALRKRQAKNFFSLLMLSNGIPMFAAGDEFLHTQGGNNNPYNQDNETTWLNWNRLRKNADIFRFFKLMISFPQSASDHLSEQILAGRYSLARCRVDHRSVLSLSELGVLPERQIPDKTTTSTS